NRPSILFYTQGMEISLLITTFAVQKKGSCGLSFIYKPLSTCHREVEIQILAHLMANEENKISEEIEETQNTAETSTEETKAETPKQEENAEAKAEEVKTEKAKTEDVKAEKVESEEEKAKEIAEEIKEHPKSDTSIAAQKVDR